MVGDPGRTKESRIDELIDAHCEAESLRGLSRSSLNGKRRILEKFAIFLDERRCGRPLLTATTEDVRRFMEESYGELSHQSWNTTLRYLSAFYEYLQREGRILTNPTLRVERLPKGTGEHLGVFTEEEVKAILAVIPETTQGIRDRAMIELFYSCGLRCFELVNLNVSDIDPETKEIHIRTSKGGKERIVPVGESALVWLEKYLAVRYRFLFRGREREALFVSRQGVRPDPESVRHIVRKLKTKAGVTSKGVTHAFRHSCASHMLARGAPLPMIQRLLGHVELKTTQQYTHVPQNDLRAVHKAAHPKADTEE